MKISVRKISKQVCWYAIVCGFKGGMLEKNWEFLMTEK